MSKDIPRDLPKGITPKTRKQGTKTVQVYAEDGTPVFRVRVWDSVLKRQIERSAVGLEAAKALLEEFSEAKRRAGRLQAERVQPRWRWPRVTSWRSRRSGMAPLDPSRRWRRSGHV